MSNLGKEEQDSIKMKLEHERKAEMWGNMKGSGN